MKAMNGHGVLQVDDKDELHRLEVDRLQQRILELARSIDSWRARAERAEALAVRLVKERDAK